MTPDVVDFFNFFLFFSGHDQCNEAYIHTSMSFPAKRLVSVTMCGPADDPADAAAAAVAAAARFACS